ncbi:MAG TPA: sigma-70 family RNA polymerase sigma factor [Planctomycetota bacterium]|jgi:RNA polymerase sigma-70 factor (ECF subfamily)|nr:sigma-70 family RNA polymerase sigma factor [Planctomycetota bacterium]
MAPPASNDSPERLLAHGPFLRSLARALVLDEALAEDAVQETWVAALRRPPRWGADPRPWLAAVTRNLALRLRRGEGRRNRRERAAAKPEGLPSTAEIVEREALRRQVVEAVLSLEEPCRSAILLRHLEEMPLRQVARRLGVPVETARTRIRRGLARLRLRLDEKNGNDRAAWCAMLLPLARAKRAWMGPAAREILSGAAGKAAAKAGLAAALVLGSAAVVRPQAGGGGGEGAGPKGEASALLAQSRDERARVLEGRASGSGGDRSPLASASGVKERRLAGLVLDDRGVPLSDASVEVDGHRSTTDPKGRFDLDEPTAGPLRIRASREGHFDASAEWDAGAGAAPVLRLDRALIVEGLVLDPSGEPVEGARVRAEPREAGAPRAGPRTWEPGSPPGFLAESEPARADGAFRLGPLRPGRYVLGGWASMDSSLGPLGQVELDLAADRRGVVMRALEGTIWIGGKASDCDTGERLSAFDLAWEVCGPGRIFGRWSADFSEPSFRVASWSRASLSVAPRRILFGAAAPGYEARFLDLPPRPEALSSLAICLPRSRPGTGDLEARVGFDDGLPYDGPLAIETWRPGAEKRLDAFARDGLVRIAGLEPGDLAAHPVLPEAVPLAGETTRVVRIDPGLVARVAWRLTRGGELRLKALDAERRPLERFSLVLENAERELAADGEGGEVLLRGVPPGTYRARVSAPDLGEATETVVVERGGLSHALLVLSPGTGPP